MRKLLRFVLTVGFVLAVLWVVRNRLVPPPERPMASPPPFRPAPPPDSRPVADDLTRVKGIGPVYSARLVEIGVTSFAALAAADADEVAARLEVPEASVIDWKAQAADLAG